MTTIQTAHRTIKISESFESVQTMFRRMKSPDFIRLSEVIYPENMQAGTEGVLRDILIPVSDIREITNDEIKGIV